MLCRRAGRDTATDCRDQGWPQGRDAPTTTMEKDMKRQWVTVLFQYMLFISCFTLKKNGKKRNCVLFQKKGNRNSDFDGHIKLSTKDGLLKKDTLYIKPYHKENLQVFWDC